jgi:hypothetical protein
MVCLLPLPATAGRGCEEQAADTQKTQKAIRLATQVRDSLELSGARVALIARVGSDQSKRGVRYTHVGYLLKEHPAGPWTVVHELNACGTGSSDLYDEGLANFYMDDLFEFETRVAIPSPATQERLASTLLAPGKRAFHEPSYSSIANPWSTRFQNSNGWILEVFAAAMGEATNRAEAQRWLRDNHYVPGQLHIGGGERAGARLFAPNIRFGDHPDTAWQTQTYEVNTGDSTINFVQKFDPEATVFTQRLDGRPVMERKVPHPTVVSVAPTSRDNQRASTPTPTPTPTPNGNTVTVTVTASNAVAASNEPSPSNRAQLLQSMQGLITPYACRPTGYLSQCRQMARIACEQQIRNAVTGCFATVSDQQLMSASEQAAVQQMQEIGYCAVEAVDATYSVNGKRAQTTAGVVCPSVRSYK